MMKDLKKNMKTAIHRWNNDQSFKLLIEKISKICGKNRPLKDLTMAILFVSNQRMSSAIQKYNNDLSFKLFVDELGVMFTEGNYEYQDGLHALIFIVSDSGNLLNEKKS